ncbi:MAG TPA: hypothetical protein VK837_02435 [Longimicrobiales bacterium]|nr:hypothetical protein [Longimicrobiales bacterium]
MDEQEAQTILEEHLETWRAKHYEEFVDWIGETSVAEMAGGSGATYQIEVEVQWDGPKGGPVRVIGGIDGGGWRAFVPLTDGFIMAPDGSFLGE